MEVRNYLLENTNAEITEISFYLNLKKGMPLDQVFALIVITDHLQYNKIYDTVNRQISNNITFF